MRILGIDLGSTSVKGVELDSAFGRFEIREYHDRPVQPGETPLQAAAALVSSLSKKPDKLAMALPMRQATFRNLALPTKDKRAIQAGVNFELDDELPFAVEDAAFDYSVVSQVERTTNVHVAATLKRTVAGFLGPALEAGLDPDVLTTEPWAFRNLLNRVFKAAPGAGDQPTLLVQIGHERTTFYGHWKGAPLMGREAAWGGRDLTAAICEKYSVPIDRGETLKLDLGVFLPESQRAQATPEQIEMGDLLSTAIEPLLRELRQAELTCKNAAHVPLGRILLSGGASMTPGLAALLEEALGVPVAPLQGLSAVSSSGVAYSEHSEATFSLALALGLTLIGPDRTGAITFRKGAFAKSGTASGITLASLKGPLIALGAMAFSLVVSLTVQSAVYKARLAEADTQLERAIKSFFGQVSSSAVRSYLASTSTLKGNVKKELDKQRELNKLLTPNPRPPLDFLGQLSRSIPKETVVDLVQFQVGAAPAAPYSITAETSASLSFLVASPQVAERLTTMLDGKLGQFQKGKMEEVALSEPGAKKWKVTFTGKPSETGYGK